MIRDALPPLFHPFETGDLDWPPADAQVLLLGARPDIRPPSGFAARPLMAQGFRPGFLELERMGADVVPSLAMIDRDNFELALVIASRHRGESETRLADAVERVKPGGLIVMAGGKTDGVSSLRKRLGGLVLSHLSKNHGEAFWLRRSLEAEVYAAAVRRAQSAAALVDGRFRSAPGMFSHERVDAGSFLLAQNLPDNLKGDFADFCAGWGYLSVVLGDHAPAITHIDLYEADHPSLEAARANMASLAPNLPADFRWLDLVREPVEQRYDGIVMNPPFHQGRAAEPDIGQAMIRVAAKALKPGGQLLMVANRGLPYEPLLRAAFRHGEELASDKTFKVWRAIR